MVWERSINIIFHLKKNVKRYLFCLKVRVMERDREIQRAIFHLLVHSVDGHKGQSWVQELGTYSGSPMWAQEPKHLEHPLLLFPRL